MEKNKENKMSKTTLAMICMAVAVLIMVIVILAIHYLNPNKNFYSKQFGYALKFNEEVITYQNILLDGGNRLSMDRFGIKGQEEKYYVSVSGIDDATDLDEALEAFESDGSYAFTREDNAVYGSGNYKARKISYEDQSCTPPVKVEYYYDSDSRIMITICSDEEHWTVLENLLKSITLQ